MTGGATVDTEGGNVRVNAQTDIELGQIDASSTGVQGAWGSISEWRSTNNGWIENARRSFSFRKCRLTSCQTVR